MAHAVIAHPASLAATLHLDVNTVEEGVPLDTLADFAEQSGLPMKDLLEVVIPARTLKHRRARKEPLSLDESDKLTRVARLFDLAVRVWHKPELAKRWLEEPKDRFNGRSPLAMLRTEAGGRLVEEFLIQIDEGMFA